MKEISGYLKCDFQRAFFSPFFCTGVAGVYLSYFFSFYKMSNIENSVLHMFVMTLYFIPFILALTFASLPFAGVFCEELKDGLFFMEIIRGKLKYYAMSKVLMIAFSSIVTMMFGTLLFILTLRCQLPWSDINDITYQNVIENGSLIPLLTSENYIMYFTLYSFKLGMLAANLSLLAGFLSLFWESKFFVFSIPFLFYYFQVYFLRNMFSEHVELNLMATYNSFYNVWGNEILSFIWAVVLHLLFLIGVGFGSYKKLKRRILT